MDTLFSRLRGHRRALWRLHASAGSADARQASDKKIVVKKMKTAKTKISLLSAGRHEIRPIKPFPFPQPEQPPLQEPVAPSIAQPSTN
jgi:hypothetical protein